MQCPEKLSLNAPSLQLIASNLEVPEMMRLDLKKICSLQEVLYGASNFDILVKIIRTSQNADKVFMGIPRMALGEDGEWLGVLKGSTAQVRKAGCSRYWARTMAFRGGKSGLGGDIQQSPPCGEIDSSYDTSAFGHISSHFSYSTEVNINLLSDQCAYQESSWI
jgi:hypothetical protein